MGVSVDEWRPVAGFEGMYEVSSAGKVRSRKTGHYRLLKPKHNKTTGYDYVILHGSKPKTVSIHRLVAEAFIPNPLRLPQVNHLDEVKTNNAASNLEWCSASQNSEWSKHQHQKRIEAYTPDGERLAVFDSANAAAMFIGVTKSAISNALNREGSCGGFILKRGD